MWEIIQTQEGTEEPHFLSALCELSKSLKRLDNLQESYNISLWLTWEFFQTQSGLEGPFLSWCILMLDGSSFNV